MPARRAKATDAPVTLIDPIAPLVIGRNDDGPQQ
jgi:hypothetical protein